MFAVILALLAGCAVIQEARLVGTWKGTLLGPFSWTFSADGTVTSTSDGSSGSGTWSADADTLTINWDGGDGPAVFLYEFHGSDTLAITTSGLLEVTILLTRA